MDLSNVLFLRSKDYYYPKGISKEEKQLINSWYHKIVKANERISNYISGPNKKRKVYLDGNLEIWINALDEKIASFNENMSENLSNTSSEEISTYTNYETQKTTRIKLFESVDKRVNHLLTASESDIFDAYMDYNNNVTIKYPFDLMTNNDFKRFINSD